MKEGRISSSEYAAIFIGAIFCKSWLALAETADRA
jgi:hypothetical protein